MHDIPEKYFDTAANMVLNFGEGIDKIFVNNPNAIIPALNLVEMNDVARLAMLLWRLKILEPIPGPDTMREIKMKITKRQLRRIIKEAILNEALPPHLQKHFHKDGSSVHQPQIKDVTPAGYGPDDTGDSADAAYEDGFAGYHEGREEPGHHFRDFEDDWYAGWDDGKSSPAGDYDSSPQGYDPDPSWEDSSRGEPRSWDPKQKEMHKIEEVDGSTKKYDDDSALKGDQSKLPDGLQKSIIDKTVEDREEDKEEEKEAKNEGTSPEDMPDSWRQILGGCLGE